MHRLISENKKKSVLIIICAVVLIGTFYVGLRMDQNKTVSTIMQSSNRKDQYKQLLVNTYLTRIIEASDNFYDGYYTTSPIVNDYSASVKKISSDDSTKYVTFTTNPYLGPHDSIGLDEITFSADYLGNVKLEKFNHLESYHLPDNLKDLEKKQFPGKYYKD